MTAPKPLTREELQHLEGWITLHPLIVATLYALYDRVANLERYRERTHGMRHKNGWDSDIIAREEGIE
jgi:hypothetical protein